MSITLAGVRTIHADSDQAWRALNDVECLRLCIPGCQSLDRLSASRFQLVVPVDLGPLRVAFSGVVEITDSDPPHAYTLRARGGGGIVGFAEGTARITLTDVPAGCRMTYAVDLHPSGALARLGTVFLTAVASVLTERFASTFSRLVVGGARPRGVGFRSRTR